jgi:hypothetical protein
MDAIERTDTHAVPSTVAVSSTVDNATLLPEHLVDRVSYACE